MTSFAQNGLLLDVQHVTMRFGGITAVNDLSMRIPTGSITGLIGPNGAGKTTAFNVISGFYNPQEGDILFKGHSVKGFPPHRICRAGMARTFQNIRLFGSETALENVMVGALLHNESVLAAQKKADEILKLVGLDYRRDVKGGDLNLPEAKRTTWAAINSWKADSPLQKAGLFGPVVIESVDYAE